MKGALVRFSGAQWISVTSRMRDFEANALSTRTAAKNRQNPQTSGLEALRRPQELKSVGITASQAPPNRRRLFMHTLCTWWAKWARWAAAPEYRLAANSVKTAHAAWSG
jgi:hypothetical protein